MKKTLLTAATIVGFAAAASAQGIEPVSTTETDLDVTVGTQASIDPLYLALGAAAIGIAIIASGDSSDGTN